MEVIVILVLLVFIVLALVFGIKKMKSQNEWKKSFDIKNFTKSGSLVNGHPEVDEKINLVGFHLKDNAIQLYQYFDDAFNVKAKYIGNIPFSQVSNILAEDQSTIENRITATRLLLVGVFALAWKKKKKNELGYLTVVWNDGKFDHETIFEFEGKDAVQRANTVRNTLIRAIK